MPEGPEIRRAAMRIDKVLRGREAEVVDFAQPHLRRYGSVLSGQQIDWVSSRGKALLTRFSNGLTLYSHNQLYGRWYIVRRDQLPATNRTLRVAIHTATQSALLYSASDIEVLTPETLPLQKYLARLGPDALDDRVHWRDIAALLESPQFRRRTLAALYLDQGFVAGIGNYLRSEILFEARVNPFDRPCDLTRGQLGRLARATLDLTRQSLATAGITNKPSRVARARRAGLSRRHYRFAIFDRQGEACFGCKNPVQRLDVSGRRIYMCTTCQPPLRVNPQSEART
jgi:endonuclease-8